MLELFERIITVNGDETRITFHLDDNKGLNFIQASEIYVLAEKYLRKYPGVKIPVICDYCYMDHEKIDVENYLYDDAGNKYEERNDFAAYFWEYRWIGFNQVLCHSLEIDHWNLLDGNKKIQNIIIGDVKQIKWYEGSKTIRTIFIHEFAHAIEQQYKIFEDLDIKQLYEENNKNNIFSDIHEFIAECFVVNEYIPYNELVHKVTSIIEKYMEQ